jgi:hypothetical protein
VGRANGGGWCAGRAGGIRDLSGGREGRTTTGVEDGRHVDVVGLAGQFVVGSYRPRRSGQVILVVVADGMVDDVDGRVDVLELVDVGRWLGIVAGDGLHMLSNGSGSDELKGPYC